MVRQTKRFKKGLNKKVLSAILAASMIMTSSSFAMAAPLADDTLTDETVVTNEVEETEVDGTLTDDAANSGVSTYSATPEGDTGISAQADEKYPANQFKVDIVTPDSIIYNGGEQKPEVKVTFEGGALTKEQDYTVDYANNVYVGDEAKVIIHFKGEYAGVDDIEQNFTIAPLPLTSDNTTIDYDEVNTAFVYSGTVQYPAIQSVTVKINDEKTVTLDADDYVVRSSTSSADGIKGDLISAGKQRVVIEGKGNYEGAVGVCTYEIQKAQMDSGLVDLTVSPVVFNNNLQAGDIAKNISAVDNVTGKELEDYYVSFLNEETGEWEKQPTSMDIGTHTLRIEAIAKDEGGRKETKNFQGMLEATYEIVASDNLSMAAADAEVDGASMKDGVAVFTYNGKDQFVASEEITLGGGLKQDVDYKVVTSEAEWINAGEYAIELEGLNKYAGQTATIPVKIAPKSLVNNSGKLDGFTVEATQGTHPGSEELAEVVVKVTNTDFEPDVVLQEGVDYTYEVKTTDDKTVVEITGIGNYSTESESSAVYTQDVKVNETELDLNDPSVSVEVQGTYNYTGKEITLNVEDIIVTENDNGTIVTLKPETNYEIKKDSYDKNINAGTASVVILGKGGYTGERVVEFEIEGTSFADTFNLASIDDVKIGSNTQAVKNAAKVTYKSTGATYGSGNYTVEILKDGEVYNENTFDNGGTYTLRVTPKEGRYEGTLETTFNVIGTDLKTAGAKIADIDEQVYTSEKITPAVVVTLDGKTLEEGKDYTVSYSDNIKGGEATVTVTGINDYSGTIEKNFKITPADQSIEMTVAAQQRDLANGSRTTGSNKCTLKLGFGMEDADLNLSYATSDKSVATVDGNGVITYQGVGECTITVTAKATDSCKEVTLPITVKVGYPGTPTFTPSVTKNTAKKAFVVTSSTVRGADGFEVQYSIRSDFWRATTKDFSNTGSKLLRQTCTTVHSNRTYYVRVRAYQIVDGKKVYSKDWSPVKTVKTK